MSAHAETPRTRAGARLADLVERIGIHNASLILALIALLILFGILRGDVFFSSRNILNIGMGVAILGVLAISQTAVIVSGGLDISVGAIVGLTTVSTAMAIDATGLAAAGPLAGVAIGAAAGLFNGLVITYGRVNAIIVTLGTMAIFRGIAFIISNGQSISIFNDTFRLLGVGRFLGLPAPIWVLIGVAVLFYVFLHKSIVGRNIYAIGGNPVVARLSGMDIKRYRVGMYVLSGMVAGIGGILLAARTGSGQPISGSEGLELEAITAAFLGGCAMQGARARLSGRFWASPLSGF
ncbi:ABC transporter permease [Nitratireductor thuwali]|uniref:Ribose import permease protein RbsC n=1 Tax=Nitratireductor thuwali TaxID=2267699 RepID=A0ABY5MG75_9HYPH|nr:Ribose import permease protein RbsC [Nitratireductor thuwali]